VKLSFFKAKLLVLLAMLLLASPMAFALVEVPAFTARVIDLTQTLSTSEQAAFEAKLKSFEETKGSQIAVLLVPTTEPKDMPAMVFCNAAVSPPEWKKQPQAINPTQTNAMPASGFNAKNAQTPPSTAILTANANNFDILKSP
jgi:hypothetical protein